MMAGKMEMVRLTEMLKETLLMEVVLVLILKMTSQGPARVFI